jgi:hypothetical protein
MEAKGDVGRPQVAGLRVLWYAMAFAGLIAAFLLVLSLIFRNHTESQRHTCQALLLQIEWMVVQHRADHGLPADLGELSKEGHQPLDPWGRRFVYRVSADRKYQLYSLGPNGVDENGKGDDVKN